MKRTESMLLRLSPEEKNMLTEKAHRTYLSREEFCRQILNSAKVYERPDAVFYDVITELKTIGSLLDQIARKLECVDPEIDYKDLYTALDHNWKTEKMLWDAFRPRD